MNPVTRYDRTPITQRARAICAGQRRIPASVARVGVQEYSANGETWGELRLSEEVFDPASLASLKAAPVTINHEGGMVSPETWRKLSHGHVGDRVRGADGWVQADLIISSQDCQNRVASGALVEISAGYSCVLEPRSGVFEGKPYKFIQRKIRYNHCSLLAPGHARAGSNARLHLDSKTNHGSAVGHVRQSRQDTQPMKHFRLDNKNASASLGDVSYDLSKADDRKRLAYDLNQAGTSARLDMSEPAEIMAALKDLQGLHMQMTEALAGVMEMLATENEAPTMEGASMEEIEQALGAEVLDNLVSERQKMHTLAQAMKIDAANKSSADVMGEVLKAKGVRVDGLSPAGVRDLFGRLPVNTFDARAIDTVNSGPGAGGSSDSLDKAREASTAARASAWKKPR